MLLDLQVPGTSSSCEKANYEPLQLPDDPHTIRWSITINFVASEDRAPDGAMTEKQTG